MAAVLAIGLMSEPAKADTVIGREDHDIVEMPQIVRPNAPSIYSDTAIVVELNSGVVLYAKNMNQRMYPASITKIITALIALETLDLDDTLTLSYNSVHDLVEGGADSRGRFYEGQKFSVRDGIYALCLNSVNTVGYALAEKIDGTLDAFSDRMNARARELGAINTTFHNPHGLNDLQHMTTAYDMAKILWGAIENDLYREIAGTRIYSFTDSNGNAIECAHNYLVFQPTSDYYDPRIVCGKTGWVEEAEYTRAAYASDGKLDVIVVTFHASTTDEAYQDVRNLLDYAFNNFSLVTPPEFGENGKMETSGTDASGESYTITYTAGDPVATTGAAILVPNSYLDMSWTTELVGDGENMRAEAELGGVTLATYPLTVTVRKDSTPTQSTTAAPETSAGGTSAPTKQGSTDPAKESTTAGEESQEGSEQGQSGRGWLIVGLIVAGILLLLSLLVNGVLGYQNKILRKRIARRQAIKRK